MDQTLAFINESMGTDGIQDNFYKHQAVALYAPCLLSVTQNAAMGGSMHIRLDRTDPRTMKIEEYPTGYFNISVAMPDRHVGHPSFSLGSFTNRNAAEHVAKAYIHALALCYKPGPAPLF